MDNKKVEKYTNEAERMMALSLKLVSRAGDGPGPASFFMQQAARLAQVSLAATALAELHKK